MNRYEELRRQYKDNGQPISQRKLAKLIGIASPHISEIENGRMPSLAELRAYHNFFRVSYEYLLEETDDRVSADVFIEAPLNETKIENTLRWMLKDTCTPDQQIIKDMATLLLTEDFGTLLLFYLGKSIFDNDSVDRLKKIITDYKEGHLNRLSYNDLLMMFNSDNL